MSVIEGNFGGRPPKNHRLKNSPVPINGAEPVYIARRIQPKSSENTFRRVIRETRVRLQPDSTRLLDLLGGPGIPDLELSSKVKSEIAEISDRERKKGELIRNIVGTQFFLDEADGPPEALPPNQRAIYDELVTGRTELEAELQLTESEQRVVDEEVANMLVMGRDAPPEAS